MKKVKIDKKVGEKEITVDVQLTKRFYVKEPVVEFSNSDMIAYLKEQGHNPEEYELTSRTRDLLTSYEDKANPPHLSGTWVFTKKEVPENSPKQTKKVNKTQTRAYNKSKSTQKTGD